MRSIAIFLILIPAFVPAAADAAGKFRIESAVWCSGQLRGQPELLLEPGKSGQFEIHSPDSSWRLNIEVEPPGEHEGAAPDSLWFKVGIEQKVDGKWEFLTDTMLGTPLGEAGRITVVEEGQEGDTPEAAPLYVELTATRAKSE